MNEVVIRQTADANVREYHSSEELTENPYVQVLDSELSSSETFGKIGSNAASLLRSMNGMQGITKVTIRPHSLKVTKNASTPWREVEPNIISAFGSTFGDTKPTFYSKAAQHWVTA